MSLMPIYYKIDIPKTAKELGVSRQYLYMILSGKRKGNKYRELLFKKNKKQRSAA
jgi:hypothetical protein